MTYQSNGIHAGMHVLFLSSVTFMRHKEKESLAWIIDKKERESFTEAATGGAL